MTDVFLLTVDSLRRDFFSEDYFPECWDIFTSDCLRFENALANGVATPFSFPSIVTGYPVTDDGTLGSNRPTIAEAYGGYSGAITNNPHLCPERGYDRGFDFFSDNINDLGGGDSASGFVRMLKRIGGQSRVVRSGYRWFKRRSGVDFVPKTGTATDVITQLHDAMADREGFFWAHFMDPHYPFRPDNIPDTEVDVPHNVDEIEGMNDRYKRGEPTDSDVEFLRSMYGETVRYLDRALAAFFERMKRENRWDDSIVVLTSDHGEAFGERGVYNHMWDADPIDVLLEVPLLVKFPDRQGGTYDHLVQHADLFATLTAELDWNTVTPPSTKPFTDTEPRTVVSKSNAAVRITTDEGYVIRRRDGSTETNGDVDSDARSMLESATIPNIGELSDEVENDWNEDQERLKKRLEHLGYR
jgi:arylsulfatase A-like enzyme